MRILILDRSWGNPYSRGLAEGLKGVGVEVKVAGPAGLGADIGAYPPASVGVAKWRKAPAAAAGLLKVATAAARWKPDVIHVQWQEPVDAALLKAARAGAPNAKVVLTVHNPFKRAGDEAASEGLGSMLRDASAVVVHGDGLRQAFIESHPEFEGKVAVVEHGNYSHVIETFTKADARQRLAIDSADQVVAFFGQITPRKGIEDLIDAVAQLPANPLLVIGGAALDDDYLDTLVAQAANTKVRMRWLASLEPLSQRDLDSLVAAADVVALPFVDASQSGSVIYAMTHGACIVTTAVGELPRTLDGRGILVPPGDAPALSNAIRDCLADPAKIVALGQAAADYAASDLSWGAIAEQMVSTVYS